MHKIEYIHVNHNYRAVTIWYKGIDPITVTGCAIEEFDRFVTHCMKFLPCVHSGDNGWYQVFSF